MKPGGVFTNNSYIGFCVTVLTAKILCASVPLHLPVLSIRHGTREYANTHIFLCSFY